MGFPPVLILDEPSCGMDPGARRQVWSIISGAQQFWAQNKKKTWIKTHDKNPVLLFSKVLGSPNQIFVIWKRL